jgi:hypothetical protein
MPVRQLVGGLPKSPSLFRQALFKGLLMLETATLLHALFLSSLSPMIAE